MNTDRNFDDLAQRFSKNIYGNPKGELRLALSWRELTEKLPSISDGSTLNIWDAGGGLGQLSERFLEQGHRVHLTDISSNMLAVAGERLQDYCEQGQLKIECAPLQNMAVQLAEVDRFDVISCHAVLEWVADAEQVLASLVSCLRPGGYLSLMFYNLNALVLANMVKGNLYKLRDEEFAGHPGGLTPPNPRNPEQVIAELEKLGLQVEAKRAVRLCYDLMPRAVRAERSIEDMLEIDWQYGAQEPFWALGRYVHLLCRKPESL
ncbi:methyltransferase [Spongiibacter sp. KMU-158]|uniref:tRNA 5-carboxymethoxyuridine methyltransferase n=1 Tax=Spongiibacter pelagi TaxID=2760804 RepID=A0A927GUE5_9GAMM|nr:methyltransferase [Spongiibacter pelagi]MBD2857521.1 methyltransferase [Spongiibacter pelagi]